jgi:hypothetical protein
MTLPVARRIVFALACLTGCDPAPTAEPPTTIDGLPCVPEKESEDCVTGFNGFGGTQRARCNASTRRWQLMTSCNWSQTCTKETDPKDATKVVAVCKTQSWASGDTTGGNDTDTEPSTKQKDGLEDSSGPAGPVCPESCPAGTYCLFSSCQDACLGTCKVGEKCVQAVPGQAGKCEKSGCQFPTAFAKEAQWVGEVGLAPASSACDLSGDGTPDALPAEVTQIVVAGANFGAVEWPVLHAPSWALATAPNDVELLAGVMNPLPCATGSPCSLLVKASSYDSLSPLAICPVSLQFQLASAGAAQGSAVAEFKTKAGSAHVLGAAVATAKGPAPVKLRNLRLRLDAPAQGNWSGTMQGFVCGLLTVEEVAEALVTRGVDKTKAQALFESVATFDTNADGTPDAVPVTLHFTSGPATLTKVVK